MNKFSGVLARLLIPAFTVAAVIAAPAMAQDKKAEMKMGKAAAGQVMIKEVTQNDKLRAYEATFKPGDVSPSAKRPMRAVRALKGGTLERTYEDGKKETIPWKTGEARIISEERPYAVKNIGKGVVHLYIVNIK
jgi:hypothetical protein